MKCHIKGSIIFRNKKIRALIYIAMKKFLILSPLAICNSIEDFFFQYQKKCNERNGTVGRSLNWGSSKEASSRLTAVTVLCP